MKQALIYNNLVRFYNRSLRKLQHLAVEGKNLRKQSILQKRIVRLFRTLTGLQRGLKSGMVTAALSAGILLFQPNAAQAQITFDMVQTNPFSLTNIDILSAPAFADLDNDGDMDLIAGEFNGNFRYFENTGTAFAPAFAAVQTNPFGLTNIGVRSHPTFADLDGDGDIDLMSGGVSSSFNYFQNTGTAAAPVFAALQSNPFGLTNVNNFSTPAFADLDNDGDMDLMAGEGDGNFKYFQNTGTASAPAFAPSQFNPFGLSGIAHNSATSFADIDNDGDLDLMAGEFYGNFMYFQNTGTPAAPSFAIVQTNPFDLSDIGRYTAPSFADLDNDGNLDLMSGEFYGGFKYFENTPCNGLIVYADDDSDGYGDLNSSIYVADCIAPTGYVKDKTDCNDANATVHPGAEEIINGFDDNCNEIIDADAQDTWIQKADFPTSRTGAVGFSIGSKGYMGTGNAYFGSLQKDFWEYDPATDAWTQKADFGGIARSGAVGFSIGSKGYIGMGIGYGVYINDFWEYDLSSNSWSQIADFGGSPRSSALGFHIGGKGYVGTGVYTANGQAQINFKDFWEYDPASDTWTQKSDFGGGETFGAVGFSIGDKGYIGTGAAANGFTTSLWEYNPNTDTWTQKANFGGTARYYAVGFSIGSKGYIGTGYDLGLKNDFWEYDPAANTWKLKANFGGAARFYAVGFSIDSNGYIGTGSTFSFSKDFWKYTPGIGPSCIVPSGITTVKITGTTAKLKWDAVAGATGYKVRYKVANTSVWKHGITSHNSKLISGLLSNTVYKWEVKTYCQIAPNVMSDWSSKQEFTTGSLRMSEGTPMEGDESPQQASFQIYPNPAEDHATIQFTLPYSSRISINAYDLSGREVATLLEGDLQQGMHSLQLNTTQFSKGVYMVRMIAEHGTTNQKLIVQ